jgi:hypothetical protein
MDPMWVIYSTAAVLRHSRRQGRRVHEPGVCRTSAPTTSRRFGARSAPTAVAILACLVSVLLGEGTAWATTPTPNPPPPGSAARPNSVPRSAATEANDRRVVVLSEQYGVGPGQTAQRIVGCPAGMLATSGGGNAAATGSGQTELGRITESRALADGSGWNVTFSNVGTSRTLRYRARLTCMRGITNYRLITQNSTVNAGASASAQADCPSGSSILGSGAQTGNAPDTRIREIVPRQQDSQGSTVVSLENRTPHSISFSAQAVCGNGIDNLRVINGPPTQIEAGAFGDAQLSCPNGTLQVGGGISGGSGLELANFFPLTSADQEWHSSMVNAGKQSAAATPTIVCGT